IIENSENGLVLSQLACKKADRGGVEEVKATTPLTDGTVYLRVKFTTTGEKIKASEGGHDLVVKCEFSYSTDGKKYQKLGETFQAKEGKWIGAKVGMFCTRPAIVTNDGGWSDVDWFRIEK
ncbi:MAG: glycoside hydrolase, partial [Phocaeicola sp.]